MNKKAEADEVLMQQIIFIVLNVFFFAALLIFVLMAGSEPAVVQEIYAKKIALTIDSMNPGMEVNISADKFYDAIKKPNVENPVVLNENSVIVKLEKENTGYIFNFYSDLKSIRVLINKNDPSKVITIRT